MLNAILISAISILIALVGVSINAVFTRPYSGAGQWGDKEMDLIYKRRIKFGKFANILIVIGTTGQFASIIYIFAMKYW